MIDGHHTSLEYRATLAKAKECDLSAAILHSIDEGAINDLGVHGLADSLHISERQLRRIVQAKTGTSPLHLNQTKRLNTARLLVMRTKLPIVNIAFIADFSSLRQFNGAFKEAFKTSPRTMRKTGAPAVSKKSSGSINNNVNH